MCFDASDCHRDMPVSTRYRATSDWKERKLVGDEVVVVVPKQVWTELRRSVMHWLKNFTKTKEVSLFVTESNIVVTEMY